MHKYQRHVKQAILDRPAKHAFKKVVIVSEFVVSNNVTGETCIYNRFTLNHYALFKTLFVLQSQSVNQNIYIDVSKFQSFETSLATIVTFH